MERRGPVPSVSRQQSFEDVVVGDEVVASLPTPRRLHGAIEDADWRAEVMPVLHFSEWRQLPSWDQARSMTDEQRFDCATPPPLEPIPVWKSNLQPDFNERMRRFRRELFFHASRTRREQSIRPKISRIDVDLTEIESSEIWLG
jgi:hypothetical protein